MNATAPIARLSRRSRRWLGAALALLGASPVATARASGDVVRLIWSRGARTEGCSDGRAIAKGVSARLGREAFSDVAPRSIEGFIQREERVWTARIYVHDASGALAGSRELTSDAEDCAPLESAVTLAIALAIDPDAPLTPPPAAASSIPLAPSPPPVPPPPSSACPPQSPCPPASAPPPPEPRVVRATFRAVLAGGLLPSAAPGAAVAMDGELVGALHATAGGLLLPEVHSPDREFGFGLTAGWLGLCAEPLRTERLALSVCGSVLLGAIHAVVYVLEPVLPGDQLWAGGAVTPKLVLRLAGPLVAELGGDLVVPFTRQPFTVGGRAGSVFEQSAVGGLGFLGLGLSIP